MRIPLILLFVVLVAMTLVSIGTLVGVLDTLLADEATRSAKAAIRGALEHAGELVAAPFDETVPLVRRAAVDTAERDDRLDDGRTNSELMRSVMQQYLATINGSTAPLYALYQSFIVSGDNNSWTYSGCFADDDYCLMYRSNGYVTMAAKYPGINTTVTGSVSGVASWNYTTSAFIKNVRSMTVADKAGRWGAPELFYDQTTKKTVPFITFHVPAIFDAQGRCLLAENIDLKSDGLKAQLLLVNLPDTKVILAHTEKRTLLATTYDIPSFRTTATGTALWSVTATPNAELNDAAIKYIDRTEEDIIIGSDVIYGVYPLVRGTLKLTVLTVTDKGFFFATLVKARIIGICIGIGCACACVVLAVTITFLIQRALRCLRDAMIPASRLQMDPAEYRAQGVSFVSDIATLQETFGVMNEKLHEAGSYLPQSVKAAWAAMDKGDEFTGDDDDEVDFEHTSCSTSASATPRTNKKVSVVSHLSSSLPRSGRNRSSVGVRSAHSRGDGNGAGNDHTMRRVQSGLETSRTGTTHASSDAPYLKARRHKLRCAVLQVNLQGFNRATSGMPFEEVAARSAVLTDIVVKATAESKGVLDSFQGDRYTITFNAVTPCAAHTRRAVACALAIRDAVEDAGDKAFDLPVSCGVASGNALVGDIGSHAMRRFGLIGSLIAQASVLERLCRSYDNDIGCLVAQSSFEDLAVHYAVASVDYVRLPGMQQACLLGAVVRELSKDQNDEWLYVVEDGNAKDKLGAALTAAATGNGGAAREQIAAQMATQNDGNDGNDGGAASHIAATARANVELILSDPTYNTKKCGRRLGYYYDETFFDRSERAVDAP